MALNVSNSFFIHTKLLHGFKRPGIYRLLICLLFFWSPVPILDIVHYMSLYVSMELKNHTYLKRNEVVCKWWHFHFLFSFAFLYLCNILSHRLLSFCNWCPGLGKWALRGTLLKRYCSCTIMTRIRRWRIWWPERLRAELRESIHLEPPLPWPSEGSWLWKDVILLSLRQDNWFCILIKIYLLR